MTAWRSSASPQGSVALTLDDMSGDQFELDTPNGAVSLLQPGFYRIDVNEAGDLTTVTVRQGEAEVTSGAQLAAQQAAERARLEAQHAAEQAQFEAQRAEQERRAPDARAQQQLRQQEAKQKQQLDERQVLLSTGNCSSPGGRESEATSGREGKTAAGPEAEARGEEAYVNAMTS